MSYAKITICVLSDYLVLALTCYFRQEKLTQITIGYKLSSTNVCPLFKEGMNHAYYIHT